MGRVGQTASLLAPDRISRAIERLLRTVRSASSAGSLTDGANAIVSTVVQLTAAEIGALILVDPAKSAFTPLAWVGFPQSFLASGPVPTSLTRDVLNSRTPVLLTHSPFGEFVPELRDLSSNLVLPIRGIESVIGVLIVGKTNPFDPDDLAIVQLFGEQAGRLIERAQHRALSSGVSDFEAAAGLLSPGASIDALLEAILEGGLRLTSTTKGVVCIFDQASETINRVFHKGLDGLEIRRLFAVPEIRTVEAASGVVVVSGVEQPDLTVAGFSTLRGNRAVMVLVGSEIDATHSPTFRAFLQHCRAALSAASLREELDRSGSQLNAIVNGMAKPIILLDAMKHVALVNSRAEQVLGISAMFVTGAPVEGSLGHKKIEELLSGSGMVEEEVLLGAPPRSFRVQVDDLSEGAAGRLLVMDDVTTEREAAQRERDFVAMIGHEVRTPLAVLKGFAKLLLAKSKPGEAITDQSLNWMEKIDSRTSQLERLIDDLLQISRIESREASLRLSEVALAELIKEVVDDVLMSHEGRKVEVEDDEGLTWVLDEGKFRIVMRHLLDNALKYSEAPSVVTVRSSAQDDQLRVEVKDRGVGIVSNELPTIFERFRQIDASATRTHGGTGIGLYLSSQLVRLHEGRVGADSIWGKGSTFWVALPRLEAPAATAPPAGTAPAGETAPAGKPAPAAE
ncbi:MAG: ATP-binding protein [Actinomycetota bacterium]